MDILTQRLRINMGDDCREDFGGTLRPRTEDRERHATRDAASGAVAPPRLAVQGLLPFALAGGERTRGQACAQRFAPPACPGQGTAPQDRFVFLEQTDRATARAICKESREMLGI